MSHGGTVRGVAGARFGTVCNYMSEALSKLETKNRIEAIALAEEKRWI